MTSAGLPPENLDLPLLCQVLPSYAKICQVLQIFGHIAKHPPLLPKIPNFAKSRYTDLFSVYRPRWQPCRHISTKISKNFSEKYSNMRSCERDCRRNGRSISKDTLIINKESTCDQHLSGDWLMIWLVIGSW